MVRIRLRNFVNFGPKSNVVESPMLLRVAVALCACVLGVASATAEELSPEDARAFVVGKLFAYTCFDGTAGMGRVFADGSVVGTIRPLGRGEVRFAALPAGTLQVKNGAMCAHLNGLPIEPCFRVQRIDHHRFRGTISGLGFAYCDFYQHNPRAQIISGPSGAGGRHHSRQAQAGGRVAFIPSRARGGTSDQSLTPDRAGTAQPPRQKRRGRSFRSPRSCGRRGRAGGRRAI